MLRIRMDVNGREIGSLIIVNQGGPEHATEYTVEAKQEPHALFPLFTQLSARVVHDRAHGAATLARIALEAVTW